jgi:hypothetical protein
MAEDWRLRVEFEEEAGARALTDRLEARDLEHDLKTSFHDRVVVSRDGPVVFCYANSRDQAEAVKRTIETLKDQHGWRLNTELERWHPVSERWEPPDEKLPDTESTREEEHRELIASEDEESRQQGFPMFEVRVRCESHRDAESLARRLESEGIPTAHRWQFVVVGADDEDAANQLAERIRREAPPGSSVTAEGSVAEVAQDAPYATSFSPFAIFGGLGG